MRRVIMVALSVLAFTAAGVPVASGALPIDRGYGTEGFALVPGVGAPHPNGPKTLAVEPGGALIVAIARTLQRLDPEGHLDSTFGHGQAVVSPAPAGGRFVVGGAAVDAQGRIVVVGTSTPRQPRRKELHLKSTAYGTPIAAERSDARILRYLPNGDLDPSFGESGIAETDFGLETPTYEGVRLAPGPAVEATGVAIDGVGRILVTGGAAAGITGGCYHDDFGYHVGYAALVGRLTEAGALDTSFGDGGVFGGRSASQNPLKAEAATAPVVTPDDGLVFRRGAGHCIRSAGGLGFVGVTSAGTLGVSAVPDALGGRVVDATVAADGSVFLLLEPLKSNRDDPEFVAKLHPDGSPEPAFGGDGTVTLRLPSFSVAREVRVAADGEVLLLGDEIRNREPRRRSEYRALNKVMLVGLGPTGAPDTRLGPKGIATRYVPGAVSSSGELWLDSEGRGTITVGLASKGAPPSLGAIRFDVP